MNDTATTTATTAPSTTTSTAGTRRGAAVCLVGAALLATAGFVGLGATFDYPAVLDEPTAVILRAYRTHQGAITAWFAVLVVAAGLLAPIAVLLARLVADRVAARRILVLGIAAAAVQVVGLSRWLLLVPGFSDDALDPSRAATAVRHFDLAHAWLGHALGETVGYVLTALFTVAVVRSLAMPRWARGLGTVAAALVATGVLVPLGVDIAALTNFVGYVVWTLWLVAVAFVVVSSPATRRPAQPEASDHGVVA